MQDPAFDLLDYIVDSSKGILIWLTPRAWEGEEGIMLGLGSHDKMGHTLSSFNILGKVLMEVSHVENHGGFSCGKDICISMEG